MSNLIWCHSWEAGEFFDEFLTNTHAPAKEHAQEDLRETELEI